MRPGVVSTRSRLLLEFEVASGVLDDDPPVAVPLRMSPVDVVAESLPGFEVFATEVTRSYRSSSSTEHNVVCLL